MFEGFIVNNNLVKQMQVNHMTSDEDVKAKTIYESIKKVNSDTNG